MRLGWLHIALALFSAGFLSGQDDVASYTIKGDSVVFDFSIEEMDSLYGLPYSLVQDFDSLRLAACIQNDSSHAELTSGWTFHKLGKKVEIRKHLDEFMDELTYLEKFLLPPEYWNYPRSEIKPFVDSADELIEVTFKTAEAKNAEKVILAGSFNQWDEHELRMNKTPEGWSITLDLQPGIYEYKFIADGNWFHDKDNELRLKNEHETYNSILLVGQEVKFTLEDFPDARNVYIAGSFNNWDERSLPLLKKGKRWSLAIELPPGKHYYKFIVDREWHLDPDNTMTEADDQGRLNSVLLIN